MLCSSAPPSTSMLKKPLWRLQLGSVKYQAFSYLCPMYDLFYYPRTLRTHDSEYSCESCPYLHHIAKQQTRWNKLRWLRWQNEYLQNLQCLRSATQRLPKTSGNQSKPYESGSNMLNAYLANLASTRKPFAAQPTPQQPFLGEKLCNFPKISGTACKPSKNFSVRNSALIPALWKLCPIAARFCPGFFEQNRHALLAPVANLFLLGPMLWTYFVGAFGTFWLLVPSNIKTLYFKIYFFFTQCPNICRKQCWWNPICDGISCCKPKLSNTVKKK